MKCVRSALLFTILATAGSSAAALDSDSKQPMYIEANSATYDEAKGETVYIGDVKTIQGSLEVYSDQMTVYQKEGKTDKIVATGNPVRLKQTPEGAKEDMHGTSQRAEFFPETGLLILLDKALVWQGDTPDLSNRVASDRIEYDSRKSVMKAGVPAGSGKRVRVTLPPSEKAPAK
ncbi:MAG TPA: lipopolysaccharide transport periplasmic protein LptA [Methylococcaceae bacterium]|jgi:lipopolysaccharide export system protein LptA|nr:lipopolysaccharide transport periplasmic protein LptA [Methylococcaceae bacterium]